MTAGLALACACAFVFALTLVVMLRKGRNAAISEAASVLELHDHGPSARGKYRGFRFVIDAGSPQELRCAGGYGSFISSATSAADRVLRRLGAMIGIGGASRTSLRMRVELRKAGDPAFNASSAAAGIRKFLAGRLKRGKFRATNEDTEVTVFLHDLAAEDASSAAGLVKEIADNVVEAADALRSKAGGPRPAPGSGA